MTVRDVKMIAVKLMVTTHNSILVDYLLKTLMQTRVIYLTNKIAVTIQRIQISNG